MRAGRLALNKANCQPIISRSYASPAIASSADASPTAAITVAIKAGSVPTFLLSWLRHEILMTTLLEFRPRFETAPGVAHVLKNSVFKVCFQSARRWLAGFRSTLEVQG